MKFFIPILPTSQARGHPGINKATGKANIFHGKKQNRNKENLCALMAQFSPETPLDGPLMLSVMVTIPVPKSWPKKRREAATDGGEWSTVTPDLDNYLKQAMDCMTSCRFWGDDKQVAFISASKRYGAKPGWDIALTQIGGGK